MDLTGVWLGQTIGKPGSAIHVWLIVQNKDILTIHTHWFALETQTGEYWAHINPTYPAIATIQHTNRMIMIINKDTFSIENWALATREEIEEGIEGHHVYFQRRDKGIFSVLINLYIKLFQHSPHMLRMLNR